MGLISKNILRNLNLTQAQADVYIAALELGQSTIQALSRKSKVKRTSIYAFIEELKERGFLLQTTKKKRTLYSAAHPEYLIELEKSRVAEMQSVLPELLAVYNKPRTKPRIVFYEGLDGIKEVYADTLKEKAMIVGWSDYEQSKKIMGSYYQTYAEARSKSGILFKVIARDTAAARQKVASKNRELRDIRIGSLGGITTEVYVYGNKVAMISFRSSPLFAVIIEDHSMAETLRFIWEDAWSKLAKPYADA